MDTQTEGQVQMPASELDRIIREKVDAYLVSRTTAFLASVLWVIRLLSHYRAGYAEWLPTLYRRPATLYR